MVKRINYPARLRRNLRPLMEGAGYRVYRGTKSITGRQLLRIENGESEITLGKLQQLADDLSISMLDFFKK